MSAPRRGPSLLAQNAGRATSRMGAFFPGSHVMFRGRDLHAELQNMDWLELYVFGITGRRYTPSQLRLMHAMWTTTSYPDLRIWNNRVAALAGSARSSGTLAIAAAQAVSEASIYGRGIDVRAIDFLIRARQIAQGGGELTQLVREELRDRRSIAGFGRPLVSRDERLEHLLALARELGLADGDHVRLAFQVEDILLNGRWRLRMNYGGLAAAFAADMGFSPAQYTLFGFPAFLAGMAPCFIEAAERPEGSTLPLSCGHIDYQGPGPRAWREQGTK